jgi:hypothetical protein
MRRRWRVTDQTGRQGAETTHETRLVLDDSRSHDAAPPPIPGERDPTTLTTREPGAVGGRFNGADLPSLPEDQTLDDGERADRRLEGGADVRRPRK